MKTPHQIIIVDDDPVNNFLCKQMIRQVMPDVTIKDFTLPEDGLTYVHSITDNTIPEKNILLLLDINMPTMSGWEFMDSFAALPDTVKSLFRIHILSSSVDPSDKNRASTNQYILGFIEKPLSILKIDNLLKAV